MLIDSKCFLIFHRRFIIRSLSRNLYFYLNFLVSHEVFVSIETQKLRVWLDKKRVFKLWFNWKYKVDSLAIFTFFTRIWSRIIIKVIFIFCIIFIPIVINSVKIVLIIILKIIIIFITIFIIIKVLFLNNRLLILLIFSIILFLDFFGDKWEIYEVSRILLELKSSNEKSTTSEVQSFLINFLISKISSLENLKEIFSIFFLLKNFEAELLPNVDSGLPLWCIVIWGLSRIKLNRRIFSIFFDIDLLLRGIFIIKVLFGVLFLWSRLFRVKLKLLFKKLLKIENLLVDAINGIWIFVNNYVKISKSTNLCFYPRRPTFNIFICSYLFKDLFNPLGTKMPLFFFINQSIWKDLTLVTFWFR